MIPRDPEISKKDLRLRENIYQEKLLNFIEEEKRI